MLVSDKDLMCFQIFCIKIETISKGGGEFDYLLNVWKKPSPLFYCKQRFIVF